MHLYWVGFDFKVIAALSVSKDNGTTVLAVQDAEKELQWEYSDWAKVADDWTAEAQMHEADLGILLDCQPCSDRRAPPGSTPPS